MQLGGYDQDNTQLGGPLFDCVDKWPPPKTVSWRFRFEPEDATERARYGNFFVILHLYAAGRRDWSVCRQEFPAGTES